MGLGISLRASDFGGAYIYKKSKTLNPPRNPDTLLQTLNPPRNPSEKAPCSKNFDEELCVQLDEDRRHLPCGRQEVEPRLRYARFKV